MVCPCGQTYGTCRRHPGAPPQMASISFVREDGTEWRTHIQRPKALSDEEWEERQLDVVQRIAETLLKVYEKDAVTA